MSSRRSAAPPLELFESEEAGALNERLQQALAEKWSYPQLLDTLLTDEVERRDFKHHRAHERGVVLGQFLQFGRSAATQADHVDFLHLHPSQGDCDLPRGMLPCRHIWLKVYQGHI